MRQFRLFFAVLALLSGSVFSAQVEVDEDFMRSVEDTSKSLTDNLAQRNAKGSRSDATELEQMFAQIEAFYVAKGDAPEAVGLSKKSRELSAAVNRLVGTGDFDNAAGSANEIVRTCKTCHNFYKKS